MEDETKEALVLTALLVAAFVACALLHQLTS